MVAGIARGIERAIEYASETLTQSGRSNSLQDQILSEIDTSRPQKHDSRQQRLQQLREAMRLNQEKASVNHAGKVLLNLHGISGYLHAYGPAASSHQAASFIEREQKQEGDSQMMTSTFEQQENQRKYIQFLQSRQSITCQKHS